jgi:WS/DGAT/MGAT family acyltransferase
MQASDDRLSALDSSFLSLEDSSSHMHVGAVLVFEGEPPSYEELLEHVERRLHLVPRYRQRVAFVPLDAGRPRWVDDPHLNLSYHVRGTALPAPGSDQQLRDLAGRLFSQQLDRDKPLWELWLIEGLEHDRFAVISKTHHALIDGIAGVDLMSVLFDTASEPAAPADPGRPWLPRPTPSTAQLLAEAVVERVTAPREAVRAATEAFSGPRALLGEAFKQAVSVGAMAWAGFKPAPPSPYNRPIGPHRRFSWVRASLADMKAIKDSLGGTVNDVVLATVAGALGRHMRRLGLETEGLDLHAFVPVSVRSSADRGAGGNQVAGLIAPLPVGVQDPRERLALITEAMLGLKESGQAIGARALTELSGFAPPNILSQAARLASRQRILNLVVTNVPGPQEPLYLQGRRMRDMFPVVPLAANVAFSVAIISYAGRMDFGLSGDYDAMPDLEDLVDDFDASLGELARAAGVRLHPPKAVERPSRTAGRARGSRRAQRSARAGASDGRRSSGSNGGGRRRAPRAGKTSGGDGSGS